MFKKMPILLILIITGLMIFGSYIPLYAKQFLYTISLGIKTVIVFALPVVIFSLLFKAVVMLAGKATKIIGSILLFVCLSSFICIFLSRFIGSAVYKMKLTIPESVINLDPLWCFKLPKIVDNDIAMISGVALGLLFTYLSKDNAEKVAFKIDYYIQKLLKGFTYFIPLFVAGFIVKLEHEKIINIIVKDYSLIFGLIALAQFGYILLAYFVLNGRANFLTSLKNMLPAAISGFSTMSSAATMPLTIMGVEANAKNKELAKSVVPATVNIHLVGDCFATPILAYAILKSFGVDEPSFYSFMIFTIGFIGAKFSVAAIPGGGIFVMIPILEKHLGFNSAMSSLITALYILFDPVITCANVMGNGAFAKFMDRFLDRSPR